MSILTNKAKIKLEDEKKANSFFVCLASLSDKKNRLNGHRKDMLLQLYSLNDFLLLSHPSLFVFILFIL